MHLRENERRRRREAGDASRGRSYVNTQRFITGKPRRIAESLATTAAAASCRAGSEKSTNNRRMRRTAFHRRPNLFIIRAYTRV